MAVSQTFALQSALVVPRSFPEAEKATDRTLSWWPLRDSRHLPLRASQKKTMPSEEAEASPTSVTGATCTTAWFSSPAASRLWCIAAICPSNFSAKCWILAELQRARRRESMLSSLYTKTSAIAEPSSSCATTCRSSCSSSGICVAA